VVAQDGVVTNDIKSASPGPTPSSDPFMHMMIQTPVSHQSIHTKAELHPANSEMTRAPKADRRNNSRNAQCQGELGGGR